ncbi:MAG: hypothetical protein GX247_02365 [Mollicutes bacterium]|jgi:hypothetical protein|nr:hypothetical protein [Mollicutes bacterium]
MKWLKKYGLIILIIFVILFFLFDGVSFARYVSNSVWDYYLRSQGFYFNSDYLSLEGINNINNNWDGERVYFNIRNNLNQTVITDYDINYTVECSINGDMADHLECYLNGTDSNIFDGVLESIHVCQNTKGDDVDVSEFEQTECEENGYEWVTEIVTHDLYFDVIATDSTYEFNDVTVNITITSTSPYRKILKGNFILHKKNLEEDKIALDYINYDDYGRLIVSNSYSENKCVQVSWDSNKLQIDADVNEFISYQVDNNDYLEAVKFIMAPRDTTSYIFYKRNIEETYDISDFTIEEIDECQ